MDKVKWSLKALSWLQKQDSHYYSGVAQVEDAKYDSVKEKLEKTLVDLTGHVSLKKRIKEYLLNVGADVQGKKVKLPIPVGGIDQLPAEKVFDWLKKFKKYDSFFYVLPKLDGISIILHYKNGVLYQAYTRGRKKPGDKFGTGKPVKLHASLCWGVPKQIAYKKEVFIRGEAICHESNFKPLIGKEFEGSPVGGYKYARGFVAGMFNRDVLTDLQKKLMRKVYIIAFSVNVKGRFLSKSDQLRFINKFGFKSITSPNPINKKYYKIEKGIGREPSLLANFNEPPCPVIINPGDKVSEEWLMDILAHYRKTIDIKQDGLVIEIQSKQARIDFGDEGNFPEYAIKVKPKRSQQTFAVGILDRIEWNYTSRRLYIPVAILKEPVVIDGLSISRFTLHDYAKVRDLGLYIGCKVKCVRAGDVIPHIEGVIE